MDFAQHVDAIRREGAAFVSAARTAGYDAPVPSCPNWRVEDLCAHIGRIHHWVADIIETRPADPKAHWSAIDPPKGAAIIDYEDEGYQRIANALAAVGPNEPVWTWTPDRTTGFWARRQTHELAVHRWDVQGAAGAQDLFDREQAVDGIQEVFDILPARPRHAPITGAGESIHLHCTDGDGEWLIRLNPDGVLVTNEHAKGDVAARGSASDLFLLIWGRIQPDAVEVFGDASLLARWQELARF
jgi:uncharacterized protein (TIGR03083 family)